MSKAKSPEGQPDRPPLALIAGPTASGKSDLAVQLGLTFTNSGRKAVIVNADSAQVYSDLDVLSARPSKWEMRGVPHRLFGEWDGARACSAAEWATRARHVIAEAQAAGAVPILVGGTGLYLRTLLYGIAPVPEIDPDIRKTVRALPVEDAYAALRCEDPVRVEKLARTDTTRIFRALEVVRSTSRTLAEWQSERVGGIIDNVSLHPLVFLPERQWLYDRCNARFSAMLRLGAIDEVRALLGRQLDPALPVMRAIGVREIAAFLRDEISIEECEARGQQTTRNYAKRQYTWFRHQFPEEWHLPLDRPFIMQVYFETLLRNYGLT